MKRREIKRIEEIVEYYDDDDPGLDERSRRWAAEFATTDPTGEEMFAEEPDERDEGARLAELDLDEYDIEPFAGTEEAEEEE